MKKFKLPKTLKIKAPKLKKYGKSPFAKFRKLKVNY